MLLARQISGIEKPLVRKTKSSQKSPQAVIHEGITLAAIFLFKLKAIEAGDKAEVEKSMQFTFITIHLLLCNIRSRPQ
jgi:hypothetical protein